MKREILAMPDNAKLQCVKCGGMMTRGFIPDHDFMHVFELSWFEGDPRFSSWSKSVKLEHVRRRPIKAFRCASCGYLELYAPDAS